MNKQELQNHGYAPLAIGDVITKTLDLVESRQGYYFGIPAGYPSLDRLTQGWKPGELVIIGARPAVGKTAVALGMARKAAVDFNHPAAYFSMEASAITLAERMIVSETGISVEKVHGSDRLAEGDWQQMESSLNRLSKAPLFLDDTPGLTLGGFRARVKELVASHGVELVFVDCLEQLLPDSDSSSGTKGEEREEILRGVKEIAEEFEVAVIALASVWRPTRRNYSGPVFLDLDTRWPSADEYADKIILLHRPSLLGLEPNDNGTEQMELRLVRNRNGITGTACLLFNRERIRLVEPDEFDMPV